MPLKGPRKVCRPHFFLGPPLNTNVIQRKQGEAERLMKKRANLIEMRAEGDIDKDMFRAKKQEIEDRIAARTEEIKNLQPKKGI